MSGLETQDEMRAAVPANDPLRRRWSLALESIGGLRTVLVQGGGLHLADLTITSNDNEQAHRQRVRESMAAPAAVRLVLELIALDELKGRAIKDGGDAIRAEEDRLVMAAIAIRDLLEGRS